MTAAAGVATGQDALGWSLAEVLACPRCEGRLERGAALRCVGCGAVFPIQDGIPIFLSDGAAGQESERQFRDRLAGAHGAAGRAGLLESVAAHHCLAVMRRRARAFASRFADSDWLLDIGIGWGWHWAGHTGARVVGIDLSLGNLQLARRLLGATDRVALVCADAAALPLRRASVAGIWSVQTFQHMPDAVFERAKTELDRTLRDDFQMEISNLNPGLLQRVLYRLAGRRLHRRGRVGEMELTRRTGREWIRAWSDLRPGRSVVSSGYSELFFHPELRLRPHRYPLWAERILARIPAVARLIARQVDVRIDGVGGR